MSADGAGAWTRVRRRDRAVDDGGEAERALQALHDKAAPHLEPGRD